MNFEQLKFELRSIDGSPESLLNGVKVLLANLDSEKPQPALPLERDFFELFIKNLLNMMIKGQHQQLTLLLDELNKFIVGDEDLAYPFIDLPPKRKFGAQLNYLCQLLSIYIRTDLDAKDHLKFLSGNKKQYQLRELLVELFEIDAVIYPEQLRTLRLYRDKKDAAMQRAIQRDLDLLTEMGLLRKVYLSARNICYELSPKAFHYKNEILILQQDIEDEEESNDTAPSENLSFKDPGSAAPAPKRTNWPFTNESSNPANGRLKEIQENF